MKYEQKNYAIGPLLYCPANRTTLAQSILNGELPPPFSVAFCLEDTIADDRVLEAEEILLQTLVKLKTHFETVPHYRPNFFIRVRCPEQMIALWNRLGSCQDIVSGFIAPKFTTAVSMQYQEAVIYCNHHRETPCYFMPILESEDLLSPCTRSVFLQEVKKLLLNIEDYICAIRVGGNDLCHLLGIRRSVTQSIHDIPVISHIFSDIIATFSADFCVAAPVWEYYNGANWEEGLVTELKQECSSGFLSKTVIHPAQISVVNRALRVSHKDYQDACDILNWNKNQVSMVSGSHAHERMNEYKTHHNWAKHIVLLAEQYGVDKEAIS